MNKRLVWIMVVVCAALMALQAWRTRFAMNPDGVSYLDMARQISAGDTEPLFHPYWSPLYPSLLALTFRLVPPTLETEFPLVHLLNFLIGLASLLTFTFFLHEWRRLRTDAFDGLAVALLGYSLFLWSALETTNLATVSPDLCVNTLVYLAAGLVCRMSLLRNPRKTECGANLFLDPLGVRAAPFALSTNPAQNACRGRVSETCEGAAAPFALKSTTPNALLLGVVLGIGYLTKAALLPLGVVLLVLLALPLLSSVKFRDAALAALVFALLAGAYILPLSQHLHKLTFGESGAINYVWFVQNDQVDRSTARWMLDKVGPQNGTQLHPPRVLQQQPLVRDLKDPGPGTYPFWYNPGFYYEGIQVHFNLGRQWATFRRSLSDVRWAQGRTLYPLAAGFLVLLGFALLRSRAIRREFPFWMLLWPAAAIGMYMLVFLTPRYISAFLVLLWLAIYEWLTPARMTQVHRAVYLGVALVAAGLALRYTLAQAPVPALPVAAARGLERLGLHPGEPIALVGFGFEAYYAHLAKLHIIAEVEDEEGFWKLPSAVTTDLERKIKDLGAKALISPHACPAGGPEGWRTLETAYCVHLLE
jgi:hypothetical protein